MSNLHICFPVLKDYKCRFEGACYGEICICPNICSKKRLRKKSDIKSVLSFLRMRLKEQKEFDGWIKGWEEIQKKNKTININYLKRKINYYKNIITIKEQ